MARNITFTVSMSEDLYQVVLSVSKHDKKNRSQAVQALCMRGLAHMKLLKGEENLLLHKDPIKLFKLSREALEEKLKERKTLEDFKNDKKDS